jgi:hypothetical protein
MMYLLRLISRIGLGAVMLVIVMVVTGGLQAQEVDQEAESVTEEKAYSDVITEDAVTSEGLFDTHMIGDALFYEIPMSLLDREMLLLTRIAKTPDGAGYGGSKTNTSTVRWEKRDDRILLRLVSYDNFADDSTAISTAVQNSNFEPVIMAFLGVIFVYAGLAALQPWLEGEFGFASSHPCARSSTAHVHRSGDHSRVCCRTCTCAESLQDCPPRWFIGPRLISGPGQLAVLG